MNLTPSTLEDRRQEEIDLYAKAYQDPDYKMGVRRKAHVQQYLIDLEPKSSILDLSCGRGESLELARIAGFGVVMGTEAVPDLCGDEVWFWEAHTSLPFEDSAFAHVTCFDVLEHLLEPDIYNVLREMDRVATHSVTVSASEEPSIYEGRELHISKRPTSEWLRTIASVWGMGTRVCGQAGRSPLFTRRKK